MNLDALSIELDRLCAKAEPALDEWLFISHTSEYLRADGTEAVQGAITNKLCYITKLLKLSIQN
jgi:hypothetical protein